MLNITKVELGLILDPDIYISFAKGTKGGVSYISNKYSKATDNYFKFYDPMQEPKHIVYLDTNSLYGCVISKFLPTSGFKWINTISHLEFMPYIKLRLR